MKPKRKKRFFDTIMGLVGLQRQGEGGRPSSRGSEGNPEQPDLSRIFGNTPDIQLEHELPIPPPVVMRPMHYRLASLSIKKQGTTSDEAAAKSDAVLRAEERFEIFGNKIKTYNDRFLFSEFRRALNWANAELAVREARQAATGSEKPKSVDDYFSDPMEIAERLVDMAQADTYTLIASVLYRAVRPEDGCEPDAEKLAYIQSQFGMPVRRLVESTLRLRALKLNPLSLDASQSNKDYINQFRLMGLWVAEDPRAILIRATQLISNIKREIKDPGLFSQEAIDHMLVMAKSFYAPLAYIGGYGDVHSVLLNTCFQLEHPKEFAETAAIIDAGMEKEDQIRIKELVATEIEKKFAWKRGVDFAVMFRRKSEFSAYDKALRKGVSVAELGDLYGMRLVPQRSTLSWMRGLKVEDMDGEAKNQMIEDLGKICLDVMSAATNEFGRGNHEKTAVRVNPTTGAAEWYSPIQQRLGELARSEPRDKDRGRLEDPERAKWEREAYPHIRDARADDYITMPKISGYSSAQDTLFFVLSDGKLAEIEFQVADEFRYEENMYGRTAGHCYYKVGLSEYATIIEDWRNMRNVILSAPEYRSPRNYAGPRHTFVIDELKQVHNISDDPTLGGFLAAAKDVCGTTSASANYLVSNGYDVAFRTQDSNVRIPNGCLVTKVL